MAAFGHPNNIQEMFPAERDALAVLSQEAGLGRLPGKLIDALEPLVISSRPPVAGRLDEGGGGLQPDGEAEDPDDPSSAGERRLAVVATRPALSL